MPTVAYIRADCIDTLERLAKSRDIEAAHREADELIFDLLVELGFSDIAKAYLAVPKWYA